MIINIIKSFALKALSAVLALTLSIIVSRTAGIEEAAVFFFWHTVVIVLGTVAVMGLDILVLRNVSIAFSSGDFARVLRITYTALWSVLIAAASIVLLFYAYNLITNKTNDEMLSGSFFMLYIPIHVTIIIFSQCLRGLGHYNSLNFFYGTLIPAAAITFIFIYKFLFQETFSHHIVIIFVISSFFALLFAYSKWRRATSYFFSYESPIFFNGELLKGRVDFFFISSIQTLIQFFPVIIVGINNNKDDISLYYAAFRVASVLSFALMACNTVIMPLIARAHAAKNIEKLTDLARFSSLLGALSSIPLIIVIFMEGDRILALFGESYILAEPVLYVLLIGHLVSSFSGSVVAILLMSEKQRTVMIINAVSLSFNIIFGYILMNIYGSIGVAFVAATSMIFVNCFAYFAVWRAHGFFIYPSWKLIKSAE